MRRTRAKLKLSFLFFPRLKPFVVTGGPETATKLRRRYLCSFDRSTTNPCSTPTNSTTRNRVAMIALTNRRILHPKLTCHLPWKPGSTWLRYRLKKFSRNLLVILTISKTRRFPFPNPRKSALVTEEKNLREKYIHGSCEAD